MLIQQFALLEFIEEHYLNQLVEGVTREDNTLGLVLTNSNSCRNTVIIDNVKLSGHNTIMINYDIVKSNNKEKTVMNHYTTNNQIYKLDKLSEIEWGKLNINLMLEPWDKVTTVGAVYTIHNT